jgi:hypothetical protein
LFTPVCETKFEDFPRPEYVIPTDGQDTPDKLFIMCPHPNNFDHFFISYNLI